jgi:hypothetical protein
MIRLMPRTLAAFMLALAVPLTCDAADHEQMVSLQCPGGSRNGAILCQAVQEALHLALPNRAVGRLDAETSSAEPPPGVLLVLYIAQESRFGMTARLDRSENQVIRPGKALQLDAMDAVLTPKMLERLALDLVRVNADLLSL